MKRALFVTSRNVLTSCGEIRLIKNRAEALYNIYGVPTDFLALQQSKRIHAEKKEVINAGGDMQCFPMELTNPFLFISSYKQLEKELICRVKTGDYCMVILSGFAMNRLARVIKKYSDIYTIVDIHGASEDSLLLAKYAPLKKKLMLYASYYMGRIQPDNSLCYADGCFVVTKALEDYVKSKYNCDKHVDFYRVPCATSMNKMTQSEYGKNRDQYRRKYNIADDEKVFIYSGGVSPWQCIDETIELYTKLAAKINGKSRLLMFSYNVDVIKSKLNGVENVIVDSYKPEELGKALCAGDYAIFLRTNCTTNNVAFPNKYLEYLLAGMYIISTPYVYESADQISKMNLGYLYDFKDIEGLITYINSTAINREYKADLIESILVDNSFQQRLKPLADKIL